VIEGIYNKGDTRRRKREKSSIDNKKGNRRGGEKREGLFIDRKKKSITCSGQLTGEKKSGLQRYLRGKSGKLDKDGGEMKRRIIKRESIRGLVNGKGR